MNITFKEKILKTIVKDFWTNNAWAICISPQELSLSKNVYSLLSTFKELFETIGSWCLIPEYSETHRLHFHGFLKTKFNEEQIKEMRPRINQVMGKNVRMNIEKVKHKRTYTNYIIKDLTFSYILFPTQDCLFFTNKQPIPQHWFNPESDYDEFMYWYPGSSTIDWQNYLHQIKCQEAGMQLDPDGMIVAPLTNEEQKLVDNIAE